MQREENNPDIKVAKGFFNKLYQKVKNTKDQSKKEEADKYEMLHALNFSIQKADGFCFIGI